MRALLEAGVGTEAKNAKQDTVLLSAIGAGGEGVMRVLLKGGADAEARCTKGNAVSEVDLFCGGSTRSNSSGWQCTLLQISSPNAQNL